RRPDGLVSCRRPRHRSMDGEVRADVAADQLGSGVPLVWGAEVRAKLESGAGAGDTHDRRAVARPRAARSGAADPGGLGVPDRTRTAVRARAARHPVPALSPDGGDPDAALPVSERSVHARALRADTG